MSTSQPSVYSSSCTFQPPVRYKTLRFVHTLLYLCVFFVVLTRDSIKWLVFVMEKRGVRSEVKTEI